jgi:hypothetical protein
LGAVAKVVPKANESTMTVSPAVAPEMVPVMFFTAYAE